jgi:hypothetical protein
VTAHECLRTAPAFLAAEQRALGARWFRQEYECSFEDSLGQVFDPALARAAIDPAIRPLERPAAGTHSDRWPKPLVRRQLAPNRTLRHDAPPER